MSLVHSQPMKMGRFHAGLYYYQMRMLDGSARDFFFRVKSDPCDHPERFVRQLVR